MGKCPSWMNAVMEDFLMFFRYTLHVHRRVVSFFFIVIAVGFLLLSIRPIHQNIKEKIVASTELDTIHIFRTLHNTARVFKNKVAMEVVAIERRGNAKFEDVKDLVAGSRGRLVYEKGDPDIGIWSAGIAVGLINDIPTCEELLRRWEVEVEDIVSGLNKVVIPSKAKL